jgi:hypothetical protein
MITAENLVCFVEQLVVFSGTIAMVISDEVVVVFLFVGMRYTVRRDDCKD